MQYNVEWKKGFNGGVTSVDASSEAEAKAKAIRKAAEFGNHITESDIVDVTTGVYRHGNMTMRS